LANDKDYKTKSNKNKIHIRESKSTANEEFPTKIKPMLATAVNEPFDDKDWVFEVKWDGVGRSAINILSRQDKKIFETKSRSDNILVEIQYGLNINL
jgi:bifunctional non-homologous end joining protein LigD